MLFKTILVALLILPAGARAQQLEDKEVRVRRLARLLASMSDEDYGQAISRLPRGSAAPPSSRADAVAAVNGNLSALEYRQARDASSSDKKDGYDQQYRGAVKGDAQAAAIDPETLQETGWGVDLLKFLGNAAINYYLGGGTIFVGRELQDADSAKLDALQRKLAEPGLTDERKSDLHAQLGALYGKLAAAPPAPSPERRAAAKEARLKQLADLLGSVSDDDYQDALKELPNGAPKAPALRSRGDALHSTYLSLAAFEYKQAAKASKKAYAADYDRLAKDDADKLAIHPETLQETGWFSDFLGVAAAGGIGYLIYNQTHKRHRHPGTPLPTYGGGSGSGGGGSSWPHPAGTEWSAIPGTLALWHFDEGSGSVLHDSAGSNNGTLVNWPQWTPGAIGTGLQFHGTSEATSVGTFVKVSTGMIVGQAKAFTVEAWARWDGDPADPANTSGLFLDYIYCEGSYNDIIDLYVKNGYPGIDILSGNWHEAYSPTALTPGTWHMFAFTLTGTVGTLYVDGLPVVTSGVMGPATQGAVETDIGRFAGDGGTRHFNGVIDEARVLNYSRTADQIMADYRQVMGGSAPVAVGRELDPRSKSEALLAQLSTQDLSPDRRSDLHHSLGEAYERLADAAKPAEPKAEPKAEAKTEAEPEETPAPTPEDELKKSEQDLNDLQKNMQEDVRKHAEDMQRQSR